MNRREFARKVMKEDSGCDLTATRRLLRIAAMRAVHDKIRHVVISNPTPSTDEFYKAYFGRDERK